MIMFNLFLEFLTSEFQRLVITKIVSALKFFLMNVYLHSFIEYSTNFYHFFNNTLVYFLLLDVTSGIVLWTVKPLKKKGIIIL